MGKRISIAVAGSGEVKDIAIAPGASAREVLDVASLQGYQLSRKGGELLDPNTDLFYEVGDSEELYATPQDVSVGEGGSASLIKLRNFIEIISDIIKCKDIHNTDQNALNYLEIKRVRIISNKILVQQVKARLLGTREYKKIKVMTTKTNAESFYWKDRGWGKTGELSKGFYKTNYGKWRGLIQENHHENYSFYIFNPPKVLKNGSHESCFTHKGEGKYSIHFNENPKDIDTGILVIEQLITESFEKDRKGD